MTEPISITYDLGPDAYGRPTHLIWGGVGSKTGWTLVRGPAEPQDGQERLSLLTDAQLTVIGQVVESRRHG